MRAAAQLALTFKTAPHVRPVHASELLRDIEELYWTFSPAADFLPLDLGVDAQPGWIPPDAMLAHREIGDSGEPAPIAATLGEVRVGSLEIIIEIPWEVWVAGISAFTLALSRLFGVPGRFQKARVAFWQNRLEADQKKQEWLEWKRQQQDRHRVLGLTRATIREPGPAVFLFGRTLRLPRFGRRKRPDA